MGPSGAFCLGLSSASAMTCEWPGLPSPPLLSLCPRSILECPLGRLGGLGSSPLPSSPLLSPPLSSPPLPSPPLLCPPCVPGLHWNDPWVDWAGLLGLSPHCPHRFAPALRQLKQQALVLHLPPTLPSRLVQRLQEVSGRSLVGRGHLGSDPQLVGVGDYAEGLIHDEDLGRSTGRQEAACHLSQAAPPPEACEAQDGAWDGGSALLFPPDLPEAGHAG